MVVVVFVVVVVVETSRKILVTYDREST